MCAYVRVCVVRVCVKYLSKGQYRTSFETDITPMFLKITWK